MNFRYRFVHDDGTAKEFALSLDPKTLTLKPAAHEPPPEWTRIGNQKCPNCPLSELQHPHCPVAVNLVEIIQEFKDHISFEKMDIVIGTDEREFRKRAPLQNAISSLIGIVMVTSGCPVLDKLRPMVYTHLPFSTTEETVYRSISMYLLAQYFLYQKGHKPDWDLAGLVKIYDAVSTVNMSFSQRLKTMKLEDASLNALVNLSCFGTFTATLITESALQGVESLFQAYFEGPAE